MYLMLQRMYLWCSSCTLYMLACQMKVTVGDSGLSCCVCVIVVVFVWLLCLCGCCCVCVVVVCVTVVVFM